MTGAHALVAALEAAGVRVVFGLPGVHNLPAWEALRGSAVRLVGVRHEQTAAYGADGYARATGGLGVALVTTGPGAANTLGAVGEAWASRSPVLVIATDIPTGLRREGVVGGALHEAADQRAMFAPVTKATFRAERPGDVGALVARAAGAALAHPRRPVFLEVPTDLLSAPVDGPVPAAALECAWGEPELDAALEILAGARAPLVWAGGGAVAAGAGAQVAALAERLGAPILTTYSARGLVGRHPLLCELPPHVPAGGALWEAADVLVAVGSDLDGMSTMNWRLPRPPRVVAVNVDPADAAKSYGADALVATDAAAGCQALVDALPARPRAPWATLPGRDEAFSPGEEAERAFLDAFAAGAGDDAVVVADMCIPGYWLAALHRPPAPRRFQYPMGWGTLGYALPAAVGAAAAGSRPVVAVCGDGGFLFACGELATVAQERLALTLVIVDDGGYGMLRFDQRHSGVATYGVDLHTPDLVALARSFGLAADAVDGLGADFGALLARHVADEQPSVIVARAALTPPPTTSPRWHRSGPPAWAG